MGTCIDIYYGVPIDEDGDQIYALLADLGIDPDEAERYALVTQCEGDAYLGIKLNGVLDYPYGLHLDPIIEKAMMVTDEQRAELEGHRQRWKKEHPSIGDLIPDSEFGLFISAGHV